MIFYNKIKGNENAENLITQFARVLKDKIDFLYFDEFQVTNIVDAMILGKLFQSLFDEKIFILNNIKYKN